MARVVYAVPGPGIPVAADLWPGIESTWTGWDASVWDLLGGTSGVWLLPGVRGLGAMQHERYTSSSPAVAGSRYLGHRDLERGPYWPLAVFSDAGSAEWIELDRALWRTLQPGRTGVWTVRQPDGASRALRCRFVSAEDALPRDPTAAGFVTYGIYLAAEDPYWSGELVSRLFRASDPLPFHSAPGDSFVVRISEGSLEAGATIPNLGDVDAYVEWWLTGSETATLGVGDRVVTVPFEVLPGKMLVVTSDPTSREAIQIDAPPLAPDGGPQSLEAQRAWVDAHLPSGANRTKELAPGAKWGKVAPSAAALLSIALTGENAAVRATIVPRYYRAW